MPPLDLSVVYCPSDLEHVDAPSDGKADGFIYARDGHPNAAQLADKMARLEGGEAGLVCASGMGAIAAVFLSLLSRNDHVLVAQGIYGKTTSLVTRQLPRWGIEHSFFDETDAASLRSRLTRQRAWSSWRPFLTRCSASPTSTASPRPQATPEFPLRLTTHLPL